MVKTKIICTIGPSCSRKTVMKDMFTAGMDCVRINMSHSTQADCLPYIKLVKEIRAELKTPCAIMIDTKGPEIRIGKFIKGFIFLKKGQNFNIVNIDIIGDEEKATCSYKELYKDIKQGNKILINDGLVVLKVIKIQDKDIITKVISGGKITDKKSMFIPRVKLECPFLSEADKSDLKFAICEDVDYIAASFVSSDNDVLDIRNFLNKNGGQEIKIISKIESSLGVKNIDKIIDTSDGIMVARGDLGVETSIEKLPAIQKEIIRKTVQKGKIAITATEMLESMTNNVRPTRAEVTDVANAVYDKTSAIMLSGETAIGKNPVLVVKTMAKIAKNAEITHFKNEINGNYSIQNVTDSISHVTDQISREIKAKAIVVFTYSGGTAKYIARFRPDIPIIVFSISEKVVNQLALVWGVDAHFQKIIYKSEEMFEIARKEAKKLLKLKTGDNIVITAGIPLGKAGETNLLKVEKIN